KITKIQNCRIEMNNDFCDFILAQLETALGNLTTVINPDRYDVEKIATGKFICMQADIKANFKLDEKYPRPVVKENPKRSFWDKLKSFFR
ncbi:MAG: hypothetical protein IJZ20_06010, partial [Clostridia bacterium]|nr:hypothetical protein [Clostridia bacterium]